jgi:hypothetical protein
MQSDDDKSPKLIPFIAVVVTANIEPICVSFVSPGCSAIASLF